MPLRNEIIGADTNTAVVNTTVFSNLVKGVGYCQALQLNLAGAMTLSAAANTIANTKRGDEWACVQQLDIIYNGSSQLKAGLTGNDWWRFNQFVLEEAPKLSPLVGDGTTANASFTSTIRLPIAHPMKGKYSAETLFDTINVRDFRIAAKWGTFTDINGSASAFTTTPALKIVQENCVPISAPPLPDPITGPFASVFVSKLTQTYSGTGSGQNFLYTIQDGMPIVGFLINTTTTAGTTDQSLATSFNSVKLKTGNYTYFDIPGVMLAESTKFRPDIERPVARGGTVSTTAGAGTLYNDRIGSVNVNTAWAYLDFVPNGLISEAINTLGVTDLRLELDIATTCILNVIVVRCANVARTV